MGDVEMLTLEYIEEVVAAGGAKLMPATDLAQFISELVVNNFAVGEREAMRPEALKVAQMCLLPQRCRELGISIDRETVAKLKESLR